MKKRLLAFFAIVSVVSLFTVKAQESEITTVLNADFTQFTDGTPEAPVAFPSYGTGSFTSFFPSWYASKAAKGGGALQIADGGYVQTSGQNLSANGGIYRIRLRVRPIDAYGGAVTVTPGYNTAQNILMEGNEWREVSIIASGGSSATKVKIAPLVSASGILVEWLKIEQSPEFFPTPVAKQPTQANGTSFTATWNKVTGATTYFLDVYSYNSDKTKNYLLQNNDCGNVTSFKVNDLDPATTYYYTVKATNGTATSNPSNEIEVIKVLTSVQAPAITGVTVADGKATLTWDAVPDASVYEVTFIKRVTLPAETMAAKLSEDFSLCTLGSLSYVEFFSNLDAVTRTPGWATSNKYDLAMAKGYIILSPSSAASLATPLLDLSADGGKVTVDINMAAGAYGTYYDGETATFSIVDKDGNELSNKVVTLGKGFANYSVELTGGTNSCRVQVAYGSGHKLFIDNIDVKQLCPAGTVLSSFAGTAEVETTSHTFDYAPEANTELFATVTAYARTIVSGEIGYLASAPSAEQKISAAGGESSIDETITNSASVSVIAPGTVAVQLPAATNVAIYNLSGATIYAATLPVGETTISLNARGIVIVLVDSTAYKVAL